MHGLRSTREEVISALHARSEGVGLRAAGRLVKKRHPTIAAWEARAKKLGEYLETKAPADYVVLLESDELYTKVGKNHPASDSLGWTACSIERKSRYCTQHVTGKREEELFEKHTRVISFFVGDGGAYMVSDGEGRYASCLWNQEVMRTTLSGEKTSKPGRPRGSFVCLRKGIVLQRKVRGSQNKEGNRKGYEAPLRHHPESTLLDNFDVHANHSEAYNSSLRRRSSAFRRRTNMYAKTPDGLDRALGTQRVIYNWVRPHNFHQKTPAQVLHLVDQISFNGLLNIRFF
jgi:hypothetical protein